MTELIDLTRPLVALKEDAFPPLLRPLFRILSPEVEYVDNRAGAEIMKSLFGCSDADLPDGEGWAEENLSMSSHLGTHVDAPLHYGSTCGGKPSRTVDQIELSELYADGIVLDLTAKKGTGAAIEVEDLERALEAAGCDIKDGDAVLIRTDHDKFDILDPLKYNYPGLTGRSARWLAEKGAKIGGTDALGWDRPFPVMVSEFKRTGDSAHIWDAHFAHREREFFVIQQLANLDRIPVASGFKVGFFPIKLVGASAAPARVVAFID